ncbi:MAG: Xaa-Pro peptidase family protein [Chloroflexota bacterium]|nr:Xaa-Pro peptidase family protein [Chloroflexota bacterium]
MSEPWKPISEAEYRSRIQALLQRLEEQDLSGVVLFDSSYILYYTGFAFIPTERPMALLLSATGERALFVPRLEVEHARGSTGYQRIYHYEEYPHQTHPMELLAGALRDLGMQGPVGADTDGYPRIYGYRGAALSRVTGQPVHLVSDCVEDQMMVKSPAEIALIRESVKWANLAHHLLQRYTRVGITETEVSRRAGDEATLAMVSALGPRYQAQSMTFDGAVAMYRGQIGRSAAIPHAMAGNITFQPGDVLVTGADAPMWGYHSELERTMIIGQPASQQQRMFDHMLALQDTALAAIRPGVPCAEVDRRVRAYYERHQLEPYWRHHVGHAVGLRIHEGPFLDLGDPTEILPGMVFTVEPGLYAPDLGGFRHSDTVLVTDDGIELLTYYPRDLEALIIPL